MNLSFTLSQRGAHLLFIVLGGIFVLVSIALLVFFVSQFSQLQSYVEGNCTSLSLTNLF
jgi:hypothetical protein